MQSGVESMGYPIALQSRDHSVVMRFLLTQLLQLHDLLGSVEEGSLPPSHLLATLERFHQLSLLYVAPSSDLEEATSHFFQLIDSMKIEVMRVSSHQRIDRTFRQIAQSMRRLFSAYLEDENLLLFLLRNQASIDAIYGQPVVRRLFKRGFGTLAKARTFLEERYRSRGFHHVTPSIGAQIAQLGS